MSDVYGKTFLQLMRKRRPAETKALAAQPAEDPALAAEGFNRLEEQVREVAGRYTLLEARAGQLARRQAREKHLPLHQEEQRMQEARMAAGAENLEALEASIEPEAQEGQPVDSTSSPQAA